MFHHVLASDEAYIKICVWFPLKELKILIGCYVTELGSDLRIAHIQLVCYTAVFSVVTQRSSPLTAAENRTTFLSRD